MSDRRSTFLEVDSKIFEKNLLLKNNAYEADDLESILGIKQNPSKEDEPWKLVTPSAGLVIKTTDGKGEKVFVNLCTADDIPEPKDMSESELLGLWQSDEITDYRVPLSMLDPHYELDKSGKETVVYDTAVNTKFFEKLKVSDVIRSFVVQVVLEGLENKYDLELNKQGYVILKNRKCIGDLKPHRIRSSKGPYQPPKRLIEEVDSKTLRTFENTRNVKLGPKQLLEGIDYRLMSCKAVLVAQFHLPDSKTCRDMNVDVGQNRLVLETVEPAYAADIFLPFNVNECKTVAHFNIFSKKLTVLMPRIGCEDDDVHKCT